MTLVYLFTLCLRRVAKVIIVPKKIQWGYVSKDVHYEIVNIDKLFKVVFWIGVRIEKFAPHNRHYEVSKNYYLQEYYHQNI